MSKDLIDRLQEYRLEHAITQEQLAEMLGVAFTTVNRWLRRHHTPSQLQEYQIRKLLGHKGGKGR